jgi:hypothetical protein
LGGVRLSQPECGKSMLEEFKDDASPVALFVELYCDVGPEHSVEKRVFRTTLNFWLEANGHHELADTSVSKKLRAINSRIETNGKNRVNGVLTPMFRGIQLNADGRALLGT